MTATPAGVGSFDTTDVYATSIEITSVLPLEGPIAGCPAVIVTVHGTEGSPTGTPVAVARLVVPAASAATLAANLTEALRSLQ